MDQIPRFRDDRKLNLREIDAMTREIHSWWGRTYVSMKRTRVKTWKGTLLLTFIAGILIGLMWLVSFDIESQSSADTYRPVQLLEAMRLRGCIADGILSGYGGDTRASVDLINRSECVYLHRALESWLNPPDFELARRIQSSLIKPNLIYGMFISEALNTKAEYYSSLENRILKFSDMCQPDSEGFWGNDTCKASLESEEYRAYVRDITRKGVDMGIRSFLFGQIAFQDPTRKRASGMIEDLRNYARSKRVEIAVGAQTNTITGKKYLDQFDYIEGGVGIAKDGDVEERPCASRYEEAGWCWALLWHKRYADHANMVLLHLDWSGIEGDDMAVFAKMDREDRAKTLEKLHKKFNKPDAKTGFLFPFLATLYDKNDGCYGAKKSFYSPDNRYSCKDEDTLNALLKKNDIVGTTAAVSSEASASPESSISEGGKKEERNDAEFDEQDVPDTMIAGQEYAVSVSMKNAGTTSWSDEAGYRLGSQSPQDNATWGGRVFLFPGKVVEPKKKITFGFTVRAPEEPGAYEFEWRMLREGQEWFGERSKNKTIQVVLGAEPAQTESLSPSGASESNVPVESASVPEVPLPPEP